jgi:hypothetical protein
MTPAKRVRARTGFTVAELMVSLVVLGAVIVTSTATLLKVQQQYTSQRTVTETRETLRAVEMVVQRAFRNARVNPRNMAPANVALVPGAKGACCPWQNNVDIRGDFNPVDANTNGDWENIRIEHVNDTVYVRWKNAGPRDPVAYPITNLRFQYYALDGTEITAAGPAAGARRVKVTMSAPVPKTSTTLQRETWIYLRN